MATAPASTGAQHAVAAPAKTPIMYTPTTPFGSPPPTDGAWFHIQPPSVAAPTASIIRPPSRNIVSWLAAISCESPAAPTVSGHTTVATPNVNTAVSAAVRQRLAPVTLARYVGAVRNADAVLRVADHYRRFGWLRLLRGGVRGQLPDPAGPGGCDGHDGLGHALTIGRRRRRAQIPGESDGTCHGSPGAGVFW